MEKLADFSQYDVLHFAVDSGFSGMGSEVCKRCLLEGSYGKTPKQKERN